VLNNGMAADSVASAHECHFRLVIRHFEGFVYDALNKVNWLRYNGVMLPLIAAISGALLLQQEL
jgi:hypothetical protein